MYTFRKFMEITRSIRWKVRRDRFYNKQHAKAYAKKLSSENKAWPVAYKLDGSQEIFVEQCNVVVRRPTTAKR